MSRKCAVSAAYDLAVEKCGNGTVVNALSERGYNYMRKNYGVDAPRISGGPGLSSSKWPGWLLAPGDEVYRDFLDSLPAYMRVAL